MRLQENLPGTIQVKGTNTKHISELSTTELEAIASGQLNEGFDAENNSGVSRFDLDTC